MNNTLNHDQTIFITLRYYTFRNRSENKKRKLSKVHAWRSCQFQHIESHDSVGHIETFCRDRGDKVNPSK